MDSQELDALLRPYNPWWTPGPKWEWLDALPDYERPVVEAVLADLRELPQIVSVTGPRRVGKSTAVKHAIARLLRDEKVDPKRILYFSFDDPALFASEEAQHVIFDALVEHFQGLEGGAYFFLDEIQRLPRWELFLKKYYDLKCGIRFVVSGSASAPIFRTSQETLLGRIKDRHLLPFSFREYCQYLLRERPEFQETLHDVGSIRPYLLHGDGHGAFNHAMALHDALDPFQSEIGRAARRYCVEGGFPEVWSLADPIRKIEYLMEQQVRKVLYEDLMLLTQYRKPENVLRFFVYLLAHPGVEINASKVSNETGVERRVIDENLPRLEMTDLILRVQKFSRQPTRVRRGNIKCYPVDMALRNAVLKTWELPDPQTMGYYAENLVIRELITWPERIEISYFRDKTHEVDFVLTHGGNRHLPIEVKTRPERAQVAALTRFMEKNGLDFGLVISRDQDQVPRIGEVLYLPLRYFLLAS